MDVINFFKKQVDFWDEKEKCGFCWAFGAPLEESEINKQQTESGCCINVLITDLRKNTVRTFAANTGFQNGKVQDYSFTLYAVKHDTIGRNNFNEIIGHPINESRWETILKPLEECLDEENLLDFCKYLGHNVDIIKWDMYTKINYLDDYTGWMIFVTLREKIQ